MSAVFGKLQGQTLELADGLNIIQSPNETGKSTWCAFLLAMFYGVNSRERERAGFIPDKIRYAPWSGVSMSGRLDCRARDLELTITRSTRRQTSPMGDFQALYAGTGEALAELTGQSCGETLLGVSREVFERSAFIRQAGLAISQDAGLERRIAALITSGEEDTSYSEAADALKKQLNRRRHNKTGLIPLLETELQETERQITQLEHLERQLAEVRVQAETLASQEASLTAELACHDLWEAARQRRNLQKAQEAADAARQRRDLLRRQIEEQQIPESDTIGRLRGAIANLETARKAADRAREERDEAARRLLQAQTRLRESPLFGLTPDQAEHPPLPPRPASSLFGVLLVLALGLGLGAAVYFLQKDPLLAAICGCGAGGLLLGFLSVQRQNRQKQWEAQAANLRQQRQEEQEEFARLRQDAEAAQMDSAAKAAACDSLQDTLRANEQGILLEVRQFAPAVFDISAADEALCACAARRRELAAADAGAREAQMRLDLLPPSPPAGEDAAALSPPERSRETVSGELEKTRAARAAARSELDRLTGQRRALGDPAVLRSAAAQARERLERLEEEYAAIQLAIHALTQANAALQTRFSPALGRRAAEIFQELTGGRYSGVALDRSLRLSAEPAGDRLYRDAALLSAGAADQLYLAARLAICELVLPEACAVPIILDDALSNFDDQRCAAALRWLRREAQTRQILLFTCHSREADFFAGDPAVRVQRLTNPV